MTEFDPNMSAEDYAAALRETAQAQQFPGAMLMSKGPRDYVGAVIAITGTLFFSDGHTWERREAIAQCFDEYRKLAADKFTWLWRSEPPSGPPCMPYAKAPAVRDLLKALDADEAIDLHYTSGVKRPDAGPYSFYVNAAPDWTAKKGIQLDVLRFSLPLADVIENPKAFQALFVTCADRLEAHHGHGGFGFVLSPSEWNSDQPTEAFVSEQARGVDVGSPSFSAARLKPNRFKTVSWLTAINLDMLTEVGGLATLRSELPPDWYAFYDYGTGIVIQAGNEPDIAAVALDGQPPQYVLTNAALKTVRSEDFWLHLAASAAGEPRLTGLKGEAWIQRFDVPDDALLDVKARLLDTPKLDAAHRLDKAL
ncbi:type VI immunity family protein [Pseudomonadota bacterium AL_CKDN230030165-1A_HGKHYDSX7]